MSGAAEGISGFLCVLKPPGMTSSDVVVRVRRKLGRGARVGHAGTLDPEAAGVLPLMVGKAARLFDYMVDKEKTYVAQLVPGFATDTQDVHGRVTVCSQQRLTREALERVLPQFIGEIAQVPPMFSALKRGGQKLCDLAREGVALKVEPRPVQVYAIDVCSEAQDGSFLIRVRCGRGTYIRTLCHDIGRAAGVPCCMGLLLRTQTGSFTLDDAHTIEEIDAAEDLSALLVPMDRPLAHLPALTIAPAAERFARNGNVLRLSQLSGEARPGESARLYLNGQLAGIGRIGPDGLRFDAMLLS